MFRDILEAFETPLVSFLLFCNEPKGIPATAAVRSVRPLGIRAPKRAHAVLQTRPLPAHAGRCSYGRAWVHTHPCTSVCMRLRTWPHAHTPVCVVGDATTHTESRTLHLLGYLLGNMGSPMLPRILAPYQIYRSGVLSIGWWVGSFPFPDLLD